jgi:hypothetical protein
MRISDIMVLKFHDGISTQELKLIQAIGDKIPTRISISQGIIAHVRVAVKILPGGIISDKRIGVHHTCGDGVVYERAQIKGVHVVKIMINF